MPSSPHPRSFSVSRRRFLGAAGSSLVAATAFAKAAPPVAQLEVEVLVCGGGCAGLVATLSAARRGAKTLLLERAGFAGGIITTVGLPFFDGIADIADKRVVVRGIALELLSKSGVCEPDATHTKTHNPTVHNVEKFKLLGDRLLLAEKERLDVLFHTTVCGVEMEGDRIGAVLLANKGGITRVRAQVVIDCTGDADVAHFAGAPTAVSPELQPMSLHFRIGHVKKRAGLGEDCRKALERAHERGELPMFYGPGVSFMFASDEVYIHGIRVPGDATDPAAFTRAEMQGRSDAWAMFESWKKDVPGFEDSYFMTSGPFLGVRETRRLVGQHVLTEQEIMATTSFDDAIATGCWYLDLHPNKVTVGSANAVPKQQPKPYDIPWRSLLPKGVANLIVAGRCHSATQLAASSTRVTVTAMAMGEAAGTAAALAVQKRKSPQEIEGRAVRTALREKGGGPAQDWA
ncbi:MAG TPA: FAD-dependent oxidoreductase [Chthoniobacteraceae bacterium]|nr:FAD-dependent oxidoreductase [Chthoniobacteraceae bacterium]